jgi:hypothetical protein
VLLHSRSHGGCSNRWTQVQQLGQSRHKDLLKFSPHLPKCHKLLQQSNYMSIKTRRRITPKSPLSISASLACSTAMARLKTEDLVDEPRAAQEFATPRPKTAKKPNQNVFLMFTPTPARITRSYSKATGAGALNPGLPPSTRRKRTITGIPAKIGLYQIPSPGNLREKGSIRRSRRNKPGVEEVTAGIEKLTLNKLKGINEEVEQAAEKDMRKMRVKNRTGQARKTKETSELSDDEAPPEKRQPIFVTRSKPTTSKTYVARERDAVEGSDEDMEDLADNEALPEKKSTRTTRSKSNDNKTKKPRKPSIIGERMEDLQLNPFSAPTLREVAAPPRRTTSRKVSRTNSMTHATKPPSPTQKAKTPHLCLTLPGERLATWFSASRARRHGRRTRSSGTPRRRTLKGRKRASKNLRIRVSKNVKKED